MSAFRKRPARSGRLPFPNAGTPNWANQTIWTGDNLDIMRGMNSESVDLIYLDPPFNSKANYAAPIGSQAAGAAFKDTWGLDDVNLAWHGEIKHENPGLYDLLNATRRIHNDSMMSYLIYMAIRIMEMRRLLKPTGSIYLHCDPTAGHYLKLLMDSIFGADRFRSEIAWKRSSAHSDAKQGRRQHGRIHDVLLYYTKGDSWTWNPVYTEYDEDYVSNFYRHVEAGTGRRYRKGDLTGAKPGGDTRYEWRVKRPVKGAWEADLEDEWRTGPQKGWEYRGALPYRGRYWAYSRERMREFSEQGRLVYARSGMPNYKRYLDEMSGVPLQDLWTDIGPIAPRTRERTGYPTQKPLALVERIIRTSSNEGDVILDSFCGCATACIAAERQQRQWVGIDISPKAADLVKSRMKEELGLFFRGMHRSDIPERTDIGVVLRYNDERNRRFLYGQQVGHCAGCENHFELRNMEVDHIIARSKGGTDHISNLQLLCGACNRTKGTRSQEQLLVLLTNKGWLKQRHAV